MDVDLNEHPQLIHAKLLFKANSDRAFTVHYEQLASNFEANSAV
jgi:hypothetical protein